MSSMKTIQANKSKTHKICIHVLSRKRKSFVLRKCYKNNMFTKQKRVQSSYNLFLKNIYIQSMKKMYLYSRWKKKKLILQKFFLLCMVSCRSISSSPSPSRSTSLTDFLHVAIYYSWLAQTSILSLSSTSCIMHCIISVSYTHLTLPTIYSV